MIENIWKTFVIGLSIRAGSTYRDNSCVIHNVLNVPCHPKYDLRNLVYVLAVIKILQLSFGRTIHSVQLPKREPQAGLYGFISGYGLTNENTRSVSNHLW